MRTILTIFILTLTTVVYCQDNDVDMPDSLAVVKLDYELLDSTAISLKNPLMNIHIPNVVSYYSEGGVKLAYYTTDKNKWTAFLSPFSITTNDFAWVDLDKKGTPELIVRGDILSYGSGGGTGEELMLIINMDSIPIQIFNIHYGCSMESFGDRNNHGEGYYMKAYKRKITVTDSEIIIGLINKKKLPFEDCVLTNIPKGKYIMENGKIRRR